MNLHVFTHHKNIVFHNVLDICWYLFWHWILITLAIDFCFILETFVCFSMFFCEFVFDDFGDNLFFWFYKISNQKMDPKRPSAGLAASGLPPRFSCTLVSITYVVPSNVIPRVFSISKWSSRFSCTLWVLLTWNLQVCCDQKPPKNTVERLWILIAPRIYLKATLAYFGICL